MHYSDRHGTTITLVVTCYNGRVSEVEDYRANPLKAYGGLGRDPHTAQTSRPVDEYGSPEEFYEEHQDEFESFEEAEDEYYSEYYGK